METVDRRIVREEGRVTGQVEGSLSSVDSLWGGMLGELIEVTGEVGS